MFDLLDKYSIRSKKFFFLILFEIYILNGFKNNLRFLNIF